MTRTMLSSPVEFGQQTSAGFDKVMTSVSIFSVAYRFCTVANPPKVFGSVTEAFTTGACAGLSNTMNGSGLP